MGAERALRRLPWRLRYGLGGRVMSTTRRLMIEATHLHCHVEFRGPVRIGPGFAIDIPDRGTLIVGPGVDFRRGFVCEISGEGRVLDLDRNREALHLRAGNHDRRRQPSLS